MSELVVTNGAAGALESVITKGDLSRLTPQERVVYYREVCRSVGLNPFTRPFEYISLQGKLTLYARRDAADQLRKINGISIEIVSQKMDADLLVVHVRAKDKTGRTDEDFGAVSVANLKGEARANAMLKAITKAKRRVTLSISGLGTLDESEVADIPEHAPAPVSVMQELDAFAMDAQQALPARDVPFEASAAAQRGTTAFREFWASLSASERDVIRTDLPAHQATAEAADRPEPGPEDPFGLPPVQQQQQPRSTLWSQKSYRIDPSKDPTGDADWQKWASDLVFLVGEADAAEIEKLKTDNKDYLSMLRRSEASDGYREFTEAVATRLRNLSAPAAA